MSHNLRTPISAIRVAARAIPNKGLESAQRAKLASAIVSEARRLGLRVANVLEAGRLEVEPLRFAPEAVDLVALVERSLSGVEELIKGSDGSLSFEHPQAVWVHGDASALALVIDNLIDNAVTYSDASPHLEVALRAKAVWRGLGCATAASGSTHRPRTCCFVGFLALIPGAPGTGLGLALARLRGGMQIFVERGHGARPSPSSGSRRSTTRLSVARLLLVEDDPTLTLSLEDSLTALGHEVQKESTLLKEAQAVVCEQARPDPARPRPAGREGLELCRLLVERGSVVPILMLTARGTMRGSCFFYIGADDNVPKS